MPANYVLLGKIVVGTESVYEVSFTSIPQTGYSDLLLKVCGRTTSTGSQRNATDIYLRFNSNGANYSSRILSGNDAVDDPPVVPTNAGSSIVWGAEVTNADATASVFGNADIYIVNYASANHKTTVTQSVTENNTTNKEVRLAAGLWQDTAAVTSITLGSGYYVQHTTFYLYGIAKYGVTPAIAPYATGGDVITTDGTYWYHTFKATGTFTPKKAITCNYLVVAGGGGGGYSGGGGGGAGGLRSTVTATGGGGSLESALSLGTSAYTVTIGAGGAQSSPYGTSGTNGSNSVFATITSTGGGGGAGYNNFSAIGGSGGGGTAGGVISAPRYAGAAGTTNQGYAGGNGGTTPTNAGGGGGGAGAVGANANGGSGGAGGGGNGGAGVAVSISGSSVTYAGGGAGGGGDRGGTGGAGGGGNGGFGVSGVPTGGTANTGGGGGADWNSISTAGAGGSGLVIVRYPV